ncbi:MAG: ATP-binding cassette domain-containing protein, partial [Deltaproteobacteria bacterium]|nr:ATP-binding cassette domain-containing protein [Deltaproteobacteria bacterium]
MGSHARAAPAASVTVLLAVEGLVVEHATGLFQRGRTRAVDGVDLRVAASEIVAIVGASGCGKTSLLRAACGLLPRRSGTVSLLGVDPAIGRRPHARAQLLVQDAAAA